MGLFNGPELQFLPRLQDVFDLYLRMLFGMVLIFQMPTAVFFLAKMRMVTARFLAVNIKYLLSTVIAWAVAPRKVDTSV